MPVVILGGFLDPIDLVRRAPIARAVHEHADRFRPIFIDHRGHGRSDRPHSPVAYSTPRRVGDVVAALDALGIVRAHVVGISWGGRLCFGIGALVPERVRSLVVIGQQPYAIDPEGPLARLVGDALARSDRSLEPLVEAFESIVGRYPDDVRRAYLACDPAAMRAAWQAALGEGAIGGDLEAWSVPCLICVAEEDVDFFEQARRAADAIPGARFVTIPGTDHLGVDTAAVPDPVRASVLEILGSS